MLKHRRHIILLATAMLLSSCIYDEMQEAGQTVPVEPEQQDTPQPQAIQLSASLVGARTRAQGDDINDNTTFTYPSNFTVSIDGNDYSHTANSANTAMVCNEPQKPYFPLDGSGVHIVAYYPANKVNHSTTTFTVAHNQSDADGYKASDLMVGLPQESFEDDASNSLIEGSGFDRKVKPTSKNIPLEFEHRMAKIRIHTQNNGATVKKIEMTGIKRAIGYNASTNTFGATSTATDDDDNTANTVIMYEDNTGNSSEDYYTALIPTQTLAPGTAFITVTTQSGTPLVYRLPDDESAYTFAPGTQYFYNVNINDYEITVTSSIHDWDDVTLTDEQYGDGLAILRNIKMNPLWYVATGNMMSEKVMGKANQGYYFQWGTAMELFAADPASYNDYRTAGKTIDGIDGVTWHMPILAEWMSIFPSPDDNHDVLGYVSSSSSSVIKENYVTPVFGYNEATKAGINEAAYWRYVSANEIHAIRFLGTPFCSAWKYEYLGTWAATGGNGYLRVSATLIDIVAKNISDAETWYNLNWTSVTFDDDESAYAVQRLFYANGIYDSAPSNTPNKYNGQYAQFLSTTESDFASSTLWGMDIGSGVMRVRPSFTKKVGRNVRLFRDN